jgi:hypothetical protein
LRYNSALRIEKSPLLGEILLEEAAEGRYRRIARLSSLTKFYLKTLSVPVGRLTLQQGEDPGGSQRI